MLMMFASAQAWAFSLDDVAAQAQKLAEQSYKAPKSNLPSEFRNMKFADYQQIQFNNDKLYWTGQKNPFRLAFYHQGCTSTRR